MNEMEKGETLKVFWVLEDFLPQKMKDG